MSKTTLTYETHVYNTFPRLSPPKKGIPGIAIIIYAEKNPDGTFNYFRYKPEKRYKTEGNLLRVPLKDSRSSYYEHLCEIFIHKSNIENPEGFIFWSPVNGKFYQKQIDLTDYYNDNEDGDEQTITVIDGNSFNFYFPNNKSRVEFINTIGLFCLPSFDPISDAEHLGLTIPQYLRIVRKYHIYYYSSIVQNIERDTELWNSVKEFFGCRLTLPEARKLSKYQNETFLARFKAVRENNPTEVNPYRILNKYTLENGIYIPVAPMAQV